MIPEQKVLILLFRYARAYTGIQFFDADSLLPPPFTFLSILVFAVQKCNDHRKKKASNEDHKHNLDNNIVNQPQVWILQL